MIFVALVKYSTCKVWYKALCLVKCIISWLMLFFSKVRYCDTSYNSMLITIPHHTLLWSHSAVVQMIFRQSQIIALPKQQNETEHFLQAAQTNTIDQWKFLYLERGWILWSVVFSKRNWKLWFALGRLPDSWCCFQSSMQWMLIFLSTMWAGGVGAGGHVID